MSVYIVYAEHPNVVACYRGVSEIYKYDCGDIILSRGDDDEPFLILRNVLSCRVA